jgi:tripartite-type tricarboxylate transporter receptor subunit TctC
VIVDNRPGGNGTLAGTLVSKAAPDGYTLLLSTRAITMNAALYSNLPYDTGKAFTPVVRVLDQPNVLVVSRNFPGRSVPQVLKLVKENPGKYTYGSTGNGSIPHLSAEMFKQVTGAQLIHVPYKGAAPMMVDLMASRIDMAFTSPSSAMAQINEGHAFMVGIAADKRSALLPDVPAFSEFGVADFNVVSWYGLFAPPATPPAVVNKINADVNAFLRTEEAAKRLAALGATPASSTPSSYRAQFDDDLVRFRKLVREVGLKID